MLLREKISLAMLGPPLAVYTFFVVHYLPRIHAAMADSNRRFTEFQRFVMTSAWGWGSLLTLVVIAIAVRFAVRDSARRALGFFAVLALTIATMLATMSGVPSGGPDANPDDYPVRRPVGGATPTSPSIPAELSQTSDGE